MVIKNFKPFKPTMGGDVPIIGQTPPPEVLDALGRVLQAGDFIILNVADAKPWRVQSIVPISGPNIPLGHMEITLSATVKYLSMRGQGNVEFLRVMERAEVDARQQQTMRMDAPSASVPSDPPTPDDDKPTLKDA